MEAYQELTLETLMTDVEHIQREMTTRISFRAGDMTHYHTMEEFSITLGAYLPHEIEDPAYRDLVYATRAFDYTSL